MNPIRLLLLVLCPLSLLAVNPPAPKEQKILMLDPMVVRSIPIGSFAIDLGIKVNEDTKKVERMFVTGVRENTDAEIAGLQPGDEILQLDGRPVKEFDASLHKDSALGRILLNRDVGDPLKLEILVRRTQTFTLHAQKNFTP